MALPDWIIGILFRPGETFERARTEMRVSYWWILLSVITIESIMTVYAPTESTSAATAPADALIFVVVIWLLSIFTMQNLLLFGSARLFGWALTLNEAQKVTGLMWVLILVEDLVTFYPVLKGGQENLLFWVGFPFVLWRLLVLVAGIRRLSGFSTGRSIGLALAATLPWQVPLVWLNYVLIFSPQ